MLLVWVGVVLLLVGVVSSIYLMISGYKDFKKDETKTSKKVLLLIIGLSEIFSPSTPSGFGLLLSIVAILFGIVLITGSPR